MYKYEKFSEILLLFSLQFESLQSELMKGFSKVIMNLCSVKKSNCNDFKEKNKIEKIIKGIIRSVSKSKKFESKSQTFCSNRLTTQHISSPSDFKHLIHWPYVPTAETTPTAPSSHLEIL